jgi:hypothetical protein
MRGIMSDDQQRMLARADKDDRDHIQKRVPKIRAQRNRRGNRGPFFCGGGKRSGRVQRR